MSWHNLWQSSSNTVAVKPELGTIDKIERGDNERLVVHLDSGLSMIYPIDLHRLARANLVGQQGMERLHGMRQDPEPQGAA